MPTQAKVETVGELKSRLDGVTTVLLAEYRGLTVQQLADLRKQLKAVSASFTTVAGAPHSTNSGAGVAPP